MSLPSASATIAAFAGLYIADCEAKMACIHREIERVLAEAEALKKQALQPGGDTPKMCRRLTKMARRLDQLYANLLPLRQALDRAQGK